ncbi:hypothetical protein C5167_028391 [Papaver somniferum]|nr:hypothetical protein C5167_028391 [Papaver somniferum]
MMNLKSFIDLIIVIVLLNLSLENYYGAEGKNNLLVLKEEDMELDKKLKILNKPPVRSIQIKLGDIYDCINIYQQPAFDHPLLGNHKIQMKPNVVDKEGKPDEPISNMGSSEVRSKLERCPPETVPIRRTTKEELINSKYLSNWMKSRHYVSVQSFSEKVYYGGKASISIVNPSVDMDKFSTAQIWIQNGPTEELNSIEFGWAVSYLRNFSLFVSLFVY